MGAIASASSNAKPRLLSNFTTFVDRLFEFVKMNTTRVRGSRVQCDFGYDTARWLCSANESNVSSPGNSRPDLS